MAAPITAVYWSRHQHWSLKQKIKIWTLIQLNLIPALVSLNYKWTARRWILKSWLEPLSKYKSRENGINKWSPWLAQEETCWRYICKAFSPKPFRQNWVTSRWMLLFLHSPAINENCPLQLHLYYNCSGLVTLWYDHCSNSVKWQEGFHKGVCQSTCKNVTVHSI